MNEKNIFTFWNAGIANASLLCQLNIKNLRKILLKTPWSFYCFSLDRWDREYIENFLDLPSYFFELSQKISDIRGLGGNQSDIIRLRLLEKYGGIYFDASTFLLQPSIEKIFLYQEFLKNKSELAGYSNVTFTRKINNQNFFPLAQDGIELGAICGKRQSAFLRELNHEIDQYWLWKTKTRDYRDYPPFKRFKLQGVSFLNEYHVHYSLLHLVLTRTPALASKIQTQSIHAIGKENSLSHGPYALTDIFCRGKSRYEPANPKKMLEFFVKNDFEKKIELLKKMDLVIIPSYLRVELEKFFTSLDKVFGNPLLSYIYRSLEE